MPRDQRGVPGPDPRRLLQRWAPLLDIPGHAWASIQHIFYICPCVTPSTEIWPSFDPTPIAPPSFSTPTDARSEKVARGQLKAEVERCIGWQHVVILDSMNAIKGYRYELYCLARGAAVRYCMVHVDTPIETCRTWNEARPADARYATAVFADLAGRFERPDSRQRWDAPLFTVRPAAAEGEAEVQAQLRAVLVSALDLAQHADREPGSEGRPVPPASRALAPTIATTNARLSCEPRDLYLF